ncbi:unnamed protein product [Durusdinium trenchii]|uniref:Uncharacterized protein n=1 Tax=Durusdinium trenchii TaxID=1381693 RepID=A0ABP0NPU0_9DINO
METVSAEKADEKAEQLLRRAKQLREELQADVKGPAVTRVQPANWRPDPVEWSTRAVAELELILAEDPMCTGERDKEESNGSRKDDDDTQREREEKVPMTSQPPLPISDVRSLPAAGSTLRGFDGLNLKLETLDLTTFGLRKIRDADGIWLRCRVVLGQSAKTEVEEILLRCPEIQGHRVDIQHSSHQQKQASVDWQTVASEPLQLGLLISSKTKTKGRESREKGHALTPVAEANLLWFAALLEPGATCPFTCELKSVESTGAKNPPVGRLHFSMELTVSSAGDSPQGQADSSCAPIFHNV